MSDGVNADQIDYWNAAQHWVDDQAGHDEMLEPLGRLGIDALGPRPGQRIVDIGCGTGATTLALGDAVGPSGEALGVDVSSTLLEVARARAADRADVSFLEADAQTHAFVPGAFDGAFSRFGVMFFSDPFAALANIASAIRPGGRLAFVCWQAASRQEWVQVPLAAAGLDLPLEAESGPGPFAFADPGLVGRILAEAGFVQIDLEAHERNVLLGGRGDVDAGLRFVVTSRVGRLIREAGTDEATFDAIREALEAHLTPAGVEIGAAVWVVRAIRA